MLCHEFIYHILYLKREGARLPKVCQFQMHFGARLENGFQAGLQIGFRAQLAPNFVLSQVRNNFGTGTGPKWILEPGLDLN